MPAPAAKKKSAKAKREKVNPLIQLIKAVSSHKADFSCGGEIQVTENEERFKDRTVENARLNCAPIVLRWDLPSGNTTSKLKLLPSEGQDAAACIEDISKLYAATTVGKLAEDNLPESYGKAATLDVDQFSTNFSPYDVGIVDAIAQVLLPGVANLL